MEKKIRKIKVSEKYPPEEGCYLRGNDFSPVAVAVILKWRRDEVPESIEQLVRVGLESGAALSGTLQTENVGLEKVICNIIANPNIRYLVVCGPESPGHLVGESINALYKNGIDAHKRIIGTGAPAPFLFNIPSEWIDRLRKQTRLIDLTNEGSPDVIREAVWSCYQEEPVKFKEYELFDTGAFEEEPICGKITWRVTNPAYAPKDEKEQAALEKMQALIKKLKQRGKK
ncbi:MAG TPA: tetrahydromethanopterin S-methyltransferase subunit A [Candidatus Omnitrophota bacterium]|nr:tetrahydromethanopterin S-methyltransferase subunit A [Candidatus Omnitrophota bacterium]HRZ14768.1 tetrahydromethanopterin S-methyltransferase subunit A [Candidatus Omnitrophota bacterium]